MSNVTRPLLQYHGGKFLLAPWIISHFPSHRIYVEPYGGGGSVLLRKEPAEVEIWNDLNDDVVNLFRILRNPEQAAELQRLLILTPYARSEWKSSFERCTEPMENARRLMVRSYMSIGNDATTNYKNSGFRAYSDVGTVGSAAVQSWAGLINALPMFVERMAGRVIIENRDALGLIKYHDAQDTLFYCDPPYPKKTRHDEGNDYSHEMSEDEHREMAKILRGAQGKVIVSGYPCDLYDKELFPDWIRVEKSVSVGSAGKSKAKHKREVLWMNFEPEKDRWKQIEMDIGE